MDVKINILYDFSKTNIYVLKLQENKYYIGKTYKLISERYMEHCKGHGSAWTRRFQPIAIIEEYIDVNEFEEDKNISELYVQNDQRITKPVLTKYERVRILGDRSTQLSLGAKPMVKGVQKLDPKEIAQLELKMGVIPFIVIRTLPTGKKERWHIKELEIVN